MSKSLITILIVAVFVPLSAAAQTNFWEQTNGPYGGSVGALAINSSGHIFAGTIGSGVYRSTDNGDNWAQIYAGLPDEYVYAISADISGHIFVCIGSLGCGGREPCYSNVFRSTDNGNHWTQINDSLMTTADAIAVNASGHMFAGTLYDGVFRSTDNGDNWTQVGLTNSFIRSLAINMSGDIFAGTYFSGVFRSTDNGDSWIPVNSHCCIRSVAISASGLVFAGTYGGVLRSTDNGDSWSLINTGLTNNNVLSLAINAGGRSFAGTDYGGVFRSTDNGDNWTEVNTGLTNLYVRSLAINASGRVFAGTGSGVFRSAGCPVSIIPGDANANGSITISDIIYLVNHIVRGGPAPVPIAESGDVNCDRALSMSDIIYLVDYMFKSGPKPCNVCSAL